jgi:hypothetical protein
MKRNQYALNVSKEAEHATGQARKPRGREPREDPMQQPVRLAETKRCVFTADIGYHDGD